MAAETDQQRQQRLERMSTDQIERLTEETEQQREAKLEGLITLQNERLALETPELTEARLLRDQQGHRDQHSQFPLLDQPSVQSMELLLLLTSGRYTQNIMSLYPNEFHNAVVSGVSWIFKYRSCTK